VTGGEELLYTYRGLKRVLFDGAYLDLWLRALRRRHPNLPFRRLLERRLRGIIEQWLVLTAYLDSFLKGRSTSSLDPEPLLALAVGAYRLLYERTPPYAVVDQAVGSLPDRSPARPLVNAVLRRLAEKGWNGYERFVVSLPLSLRYGLTEFWERCLRKVVPEGELESLLESLRTPLPLYLGSSRHEVSADQLLRRLQGEGIPAEPAEVPGVVAVSGKERGKVFLSRLYREGEVVIQDKAIRATLELILPQIEPPLWDPFTAPGGKILFLMKRGFPTPLASDEKFHRLKLLLEEARRISAPLPFLYAGRAETPPLKEGVSFRTILCDLPCSSSGTLPNHPEVALRVKEEDLTRLKEEQIRWLKGVERYLSPGGRILFMTCSLFREENEEVVSAFLRENPEFHLVPLPHPLEPGNLGETLRFFPHRHRTIGFTVHLIERRG
jgi:16S rRNA C967 or C1407 C5-methylase (RsmB/RsmF family)